jgi:ferredoxin
MEATCFGDCLHILLWLAALHDWLSPFYFHPDGHPFWLRQDLSEGSNMNVSDTCIGCGSCVPYCPMEAISLGPEKAEIDQDECVECNACFRAEVCPTDSLIRPELKWPRSVRRVFSDPAPQHGLTGVPGRGTEEMKTNDVTGRYRVGEAGFVLDVGRPG